jgi:hypothetical protein
VTEKSGYQPWYRKPKSKIEVSATSEPARESERGYTPVSILTGVRISSEDLAEAVYPQQPTHGERTRDYRASRHTSDPSNETDDTSDLAVVVQ